MYCIATAKPISLCNDGGCIRRMMGSASCGGWENYKMGEGRHTVTLFMK
jgi:hypothetical protein